MAKLVFDNRSPHPRALYPSGGSNFSSGITSRSGKSSPGCDAKTRDSLTSKISASNKDAIKVPCIVCHAFRGSKCRSKQGEALTGIHNKRIQDYQKRLSI
jgi:hypothetical protein